MLNNSCQLILETRSPVTSFQAHDWLWTRIIKAARIFLFTLCLLPFQRYLCFESVVQLLSLISYRWVCFWSELRELPFLLIWFILTKTWLGLQARRDCFILGWGIIVRLVFVYRFNHVSSVIRNERLSPFLVLLTLHDYVVNAAFDILKFVEQLIQDTFILSLSPLSLSEEFALESGVLSLSWCEILVGRNTVESTHDKRLKVSSFTIWRLD